MNKNHLGELLWTRGRSDVVMLAPRFGIGVRVRAHSVYTLAAWVWLHGCIGHAPDLQTYTRPHGKVWHVLYHPVSVLLVDGAIALLSNRRVPPWYYQPVMFVLLIS